MKTTHLLLSLGLALAGAGPGRAYVVGPEGVVARTTVYFLEPANFTDVREGSMRSDAARDEILTELRKYLVEEASRYIASGYRLIITVTNVDLAGDFEPWHGSQFDDIRIVKNIYPPRIRLVFRLTDAEGNILREGERELTDLSFMMKFSINQNDPRRHEKALIDDWLRKEFRPVKGRNG